MRVGKNVWILGLALVLTAGAAMAAEIDEPVPAAPEQAEADLQAVEVEALPGACGESQVEFATDEDPPQGFTCSCECTCPASGNFVKVIFTLPEWTNRTCESFDGEGCSLGKFDTCNTPRRYANCTTL